MNILKINCYGKMRQLSREPRLGGSTIIGRFTVLTIIGYSMISYFMFWIVVLGYTYVAACARS